MVKVLDDTSQDNWWLADKGQGLTEQEVSLMLVALKLAKMILIDFALLEYKFI